MNLNTKKIISINIFSLNSLTNMARVNQQRAQTREKGAKSVPRRIQLHLLIVPMKIYYYL